MNKTKNEKSYIIHNGKNIYFNITYKNVKNMTLKVKDTIQVVAPFFISKIEINNFIYKNIDKILFVLEKKTNNKYFNHKKNMIRMMGEDYQIVVNISNSKSTWKIIGNSIYMNIKSINDKELVLRRLFKKKSEEYLKNRLEEISNATKIKYNSVNFKWMTAKWGYCDNKNNIVISTKTIILDKIMIDYILVHELCHTVEHNHSKNFWLLVSKIMPDYKEIIKKIKSINLI
ncbi:MAG: M48 family metallopeptidase [Mycoplasmoidaceae bacterium]